MIHNMRTNPSWFRLINSGAQTAVVIKSDRMYAVGDTIRFQEADLAAPGYTGREVGRVISCVINSSDNPDAIRAGWCVIGMRPLAAGSEAELPAGTIEECIKRLAKNVRNEPSSVQFKRGDRFAEKSISR